ncbi:hypothetical protein M0R45_022493 [Rubus argutus]|uniref:Protein POLLEN DEFECTIVE IN GUIDANCE 1 n=1 Tax=Rubus argutus TaxID=59490 RepID=A0AAW1XEX8_RUBAR
MALRSSSRKFSFEILSRNSSLDEEEAEEEEAAAALFYRSNSDPIRSKHDDANDHKPSARRKRKKKKRTTPNCSIPESPTAADEVVVSNSAHQDSNNGENNGLEFNYSQTVLCSVTTEVSDPEFQNTLHGAAELRQRTVNAGAGGAVADETMPSAVEGEAKEESRVEASPVAKPNGNLVPKLQTTESLDWQRVMAEDPNYAFLVDKSPLKYFMEEMSNGNSLRSTTTQGNEKERERVYDTIFRLPWRCELLINVGFFVCFDSFLSLLTIMPTRIVMTLWRLLHTRQFKRPSAAELSDFGCFTIMACGVMLLEQTDISLIYHMIRGQGTIKLYVVYNVLEIFDKLCQSFNGDAITLSTCIVAHNNALFALLVSNNFAEIKSNVFKRYSKDNIHSLVYFDSVERFHISAFIIFILAQNILEAEGPWFESFLYNAGVVFICEMIIDIIKHSFIAKFNDIKPIAYSEFLEDLCKQTLNIQPEAAKKNLTFIPLAPACVVIRVLTPVYAAHLPYSPLPWKLFWILVLFAMTYVMLTSLKVLIGMGLQKHASWYVNRCRRRKHHLHYD